MNVLIPVDGSDFTKRMLSYIAAHDELLGAGHDYTIFTAVAPVPPNAARYLDRQTLDEYYRSEAEEVLRPVRRFAEQHGWTVNTAHVAGHAAEAIAAYAEAHHPDLIVMGTHGHSSFAGVILGSVATKVLSRCKSPVLLVR
jgi:nucleotide-binding universal stress UspA family protein